MKLKKIALILSLIALFACENPQGVNENTAQNTEETPNTEPTTQPSTEPSVEPSPSPSQSPSPTPPGTPVINSFFPLSEDISVTDRTSNDLTFKFEATDPENQPLQYGWIYRIQNTTGAIDDFNHELKLSTLLKEVKPQRQVTIELAAVVVDTTGNSTSHLWKIYIDQNAVYVSANTGDDNQGLGLPWSPYKTITKGMLESEHLEIFDVRVAKGTYTDSNYSSKGLLTGGYDPTTWIRVSSSRESIIEPVAGAFNIIDVSEKLKIQGFKIAPKTTVRGSLNSIALLAVNSPLLEISECDLNAVDAANAPELEAAMYGANGAIGYNGFNAGSDSIFTSYVGRRSYATSQYCATGGSAVMGGYGGQGGNTGINPERGGTSAQGAAGGDFESSGAKGDKGAVGINGPRPETYGRISGNAFISATASNGTNGANGIGGGGGGGVSYDYHFGFTHAGAGGGTGGNGGCAGYGGQGGQSGGSSFAALLIRSSVSFDQVKFKTGRGGRGSNGAAGGAGGNGGQGDQGGYSYPTNSERGGSGGAGGNGGKGGNGGPGNGGLSVGIYLSSSSTLTLATVNYQLGSGGTAGTREGSTGLTGLSLVTYKE